MMRRVESPLDQESPVVEAGVNITVILLIVFICLHVHTSQVRGALQLRAPLWEIKYWPLVDYDFNICSKRAHRAYILHTDY